MHTLEIGSEDSELVGVWLLLVNKSYLIEASKIIAYLTNLRTVKLDFTLIQQFYKNNDGLYNVLP